MSGNVSRDTQLPRTEGRAFLRSLYEHAPIGIAHVASDGRLRWVNSALCQMLGYSQTELLDKAFEEIVPAEDRPWQTRLLSQILAGKFRCYEAEERLLHRTGTPV